MNRFDSTHGWSRSGDRGNDVDVGYEVVGSVRSFDCGRRRRSSVSRSLSDRVMLLFLLKCRCRRRRESRLFLMLSESDLRRSGISRESLLTVDRRVLRSDLVRVMLVVITVRRGKGELFLLRRRAVEIQLLRRNFGRVERVERCIRDGVDSGIHLVIVH